MARTIRVGMAYPRGALWLSATAGGALGAPLAGIVPGRRPEAAPAVREVFGESERRMRILLPVGLGGAEGIGALGDQENWYAPYTRPDMPPLYELHGWRRKP